MLLLVTGTHSLTGHSDTGHAVGTELTAINQKAENGCRWLEEKQMKWYYSLPKPLLTSHLIFQRGYDSTLSGELCPHNTSE